MQYRFDSIAGGAVMLLSAAIRKACLEALQAKSYKRPLRSFLSIHSLLLLSLPDSRASAGRIFPRPDPVAS